MSRRPRSELRGAAQTPRARAAIHGWSALQTEQAVTYDRSRNFYALLEDLPVRKNSLRGGQSKPRLLMGVPY
jgi:hypothetical protein